MIFSATATTVGAVACSHGWDSYDPRLGTASASGSGGGTAQSVSASESASSTTAASSGSSGSGGAGGADAGPPTYRDLILAEGPLAYWRLGDMQGPFIIDELGQHSGNASPNGLTYGVKGLITGDTAMAFDGQEGHFSVDGDWDFAGQSPYAFELWIKLAPSTNSFPRIISKEVPSDPRQGYLLMGGALVDGGNPFVGTERWENGVSLLSIYDKMTVPIAEWTYVVAQFDGVNGELYVNGKKSKANAAKPDSGLLINPNALTIGSEAKGNAAFAGSIDELAIYGKSLSPLVIGNHYDAGLAGL